MGTFLKYALKSSEGPEEWLKFFSLSGAAFAKLEKTPSVPGFEDWSNKKTYHTVTKEAHKLNVKDKLSGFTAAVSLMSMRKVKYHLVILDLEVRTINVIAYSKDELAEANKNYVGIEEEIRNGAQKQAVLVSAGSADMLRRAYPNYFLDTHKFLEQLDLIEKLSKK